MNNSTTGHGAATSSGLGYAVGISVGILFLTISITLATYFCARPHLASNIPRQNPAVAPNQNLADVEVGLDEATLMSYPKILYSEAKLQNKDTTSSCCSICLADYKDTDLLRLLPDCGHLFHLKCVDPWLMLHPTCPVCRNSPMPTPLSTPLAEVVPLASRQN